MYRSNISIAILLVLGLYTGSLSGQGTTIHLVQDGSDRPVQFANVCWEQIESEKRLKGNTISTAEGNVTFPFRKEKE